MSASQPSRCCFLLFAGALLGGAAWAAPAARASTPAEGARPDAPPKPRLVLVGDSTVKNGSGRGDRGLWGWGQVIAERFDTSKIDIENRALGGRSSRTYLTEGLWEKSLARLRPGDFVLMQFGHNDGGKMFDSDRPRASLKGAGDESVDGVVEMTGKSETVHSYGWYLRRYIADAQARGATAIVLSPIPRDRWSDGQVLRADKDYGLWAKQAAEQAGAPYIDLNEITARRFERDGEQKVGAEYFTEKDWTHTTEAGARVVAECVAQGIRDLEGSPLVRYLKPSKQQPTDGAVWRFDFFEDATAVEGPASTSTVGVTLATKYSPATGYGFEPEGATPTLAGDACTSAEPFYFSAALPEGNYRVRVHAAGAEPLTVKSELRRLELHGWRPDETGGVAEFLVNLRRPEIAGDDRRVRLKPRETGSEAWAWDEKLTLEFAGPAPRVSALTIEPAPGVPTVYLMGDSTVADQPLEPWNSWGQMFPYFFDNSVAVANHSESGESIRGSLGARRFDKIFSLIRPGDWLFVQFGHNDMKDKADDALAKYRENLVSIVERTRAAGATPVLVTSMERKPAPDRLSLGDYPPTVRDVAEETGAAMIDLNKMSAELYEALGPNVDLAFQDNTHHTTYGSWLLAKCVAQGIRDTGLDLADALADDFGGFDPAKPDQFESLQIPASPRRD
ncbi:Rhamnogalacturonan acetylesterase RhgT [Pseudobythopirellula maris]|uniref:Rhamnogalacturonan acetylesterase RhgT n=1 Tax=Pseudobythopirellula maris TaxID=2527991 RepID=A0A5C5ZGL9_9BACT|nr:rhamnogalacturonan acetylesterase [Pseudobythopirellula maris]TWT86207.1 Rhamnogalacturonan acetylesterase RhgT [Pseudobythopirellula maris]